MVEAGLRRSSVRINGFVACFATNGNSDVADSETDVAMVNRYCGQMLNEWMRHAMLGAKIKQAEMSRRLSDHLGRSIDRAAINKMLKGPIPGGRKISGDEVLAIASICGISPPTDSEYTESLAGEVNKNTVFTTQIIDKIEQSNPKLDKTDGAYLTPADHIPIAGSRLARDVPVLGVAVGGEDADFSFNGDTIDHVRRPVGISGQKGVYALYVVGTSMAPKFEEGDLIYVSTTRPPVIGDYVVIELYPETVDGIGKGYIKRLKSRNSVKTICTQHNPPKEIQFSQNRIKAVHRVIPWNELLGV